MTHGILDIDKKTLRQYLSELNSGAEIIDWISINEFIEGVIKKYSLYNLKQFNKGLDEALNTSSNLTSMLSGFSSEYNLLNKYEPIPVPEVDLKNIDKLTKTDYYHLLLKYGPMLCIRYDQTLDYVRIKNVEDNTFTLDYNYHGTRFLKMLQMSWLVGVNPVGVFLHRKSTYNLKLSFWGNKYIYPEYAEFFSFFGFSQKIKQSIKSLRKSKHGDIIAKIFKAIKKHAPHLMPKGYQNLTQSNCKNMPVFFYLKPLKDQARKRKLNINFNIRKKWSDPISKQKKYIKNVNVITNEFIKNIERNINRCLTLKESDHHYLKNTSGYYFKYYREEYNHKVGRYLNYINLSQRKTLPYIEIKESYSNSTKTSYQFVNILDKNDMPLFDLFKTKDLFASLHNEFNEVKQLLKKINTILPLYYLDREKSNAIYREISTKLTKITQILRFINQKRNTLIKDTNIFSDYIKSFKHLKKDGKYKTKHLRIMFNAYRENILTLYRMINDDHKASITDIKAFIQSQKKGSNNALDHHLQAIQKACFLSDKKAIKTLFKMLPEVIKNYSEKEQEKRIQQFLQEKEKQKKAINKIASSSSPKEKAGKSNPIQKTYLKMIKSNIKPKKKTLQYGFKSLMGAIKKNRKNLFQYALHFRMDIQKFEKQSLRIIEKYSQMAQRNHKTNIELKEVQKNIKTKAKKSSGKKHKPLYWDFVHYYISLVSIEWSEAEKYKQTLIQRLETLDSTRSKKRYDLLISELQSIRHADSSLKQI